MSNPRIDNKMPQFRRQMLIKLHEGIGDLANDILEHSRNLAPFKKGALRSQSDTTTTAPLKWAVRYKVEYASYQERGARRDGSHKVRKYTTSGTGSKFLERGANAEYAKASRTIIKHLKRIRV